MFPRQTFFFALQLVPVLVTVSGPGGGGEFLHVKVYSNSTGMCHGNGVHFVKKKNK